MYTPWAIQSAAGRKMREFNKQNPLKLDPPCVEGSNLRDYLNSEDVRKGLNIKGEQKWDLCMNIFYTKLPIASEWIY